MRRKLLKHLITWLDGDTDDYVTVTYSDDLKNISGSFRLSRKLYVAYVLITGSVCRHILKFEVHRLPSLLNMLAYDIYLLHVLDKELDTCVKVRSTIGRKPNDFMRKEVCISLCTSDFNNPIVTITNGEVKTLVLNA